MSGWRLPPKQYKENLLQHGIINFPLDVAATEAAQKLTESAIRARVESDIAILGNHKLGKPDRAAGADRETGASAVNDTRFITTKLRAECDVGPRGDQWTLTEPLIACWKGKRIEVCSGYTTDGASIPKFAWSIIGHPWDYYLPAAIVHDVLYNSEVWPRQQEDECFHDMMTVLSVRYIRLHAMYYFVRIFGSTAWWRHTPQTIAHAREHLTISDLCPSETDLEPA